MSELTLQNYEPKPTIEGVQIINLKQFFDDGGSFCEVLKLIGHVGVEQSTLYDVGESKLNFNELQVNHSKVLKGAIKAFHYHQHQTDVWYVLDRAIVCLADLRNKGGVVTTSMKLAAGVIPQLIIIPPGVAHGIAAPYGDVNMIYFVDKHFNPKDEWRLKWDLLGKHVWEIEHG